MRVPAPTGIIIENVLQKISKKEKLFLPPGLATTIAEKSERNIRRAILQFQTCKMQTYPFKEKQEIHTPEWQLAIRDIKKDITIEQSPKK
jgi:replication factor C subunit 3/5